MPSTGARRDRPTRRVKAARRRAAFHAERARSARTPAERYKAAENALLSAVAHSTHPEATARRLGGDLADHARRVIDQAGLTPASRALYEAKLADPRGERARLAAALMCLRGAIGHLGEADRDRMFDHYAAELTREAGAIAARR